MIVLTLLIVGLVFEFVLTGKSQEVQDGVRGFRAFIGVALVVAFILQVLLGIGA